MSTHNIKVEPGDEPNSLRVSIEAPNNVLAPHVGKKALEIREMGFMVNEEIPDCATCVENEQGDYIFKWCEVKWTIPN